MKLGDYFGKKPVILVLAYYRCPMLCTLVSNGLVQGMRDMPFTLGTEFNVVTVSFDPRETSGPGGGQEEDLRRQLWPAGRCRRLALSDRQAGGDREADQRRGLSLRLRCQARPVHPHQRHHDPDAARARSPATSTAFSFPRRDLRLGLVEASANKIGSPTDQVLLYCFHYDPATGKYTASILNFVRVGGVLTRGRAGRHGVVPVRMRTAQQATAPSLKQQASPDRRVAGGGGP